MTAFLLTPLPPLVLLAIGAPVNCVAAVASFWRRSLDAGGAAAGAALGTVIFAAAGPFLWLLMAVFVVSSSALTRFHSSQNEWLASIQEKGGRRDKMQVMANGGIGLVMAVLLRVTREPAFAVALAAAFASATADTWASEIGVLSRRQPVSPVTFRPIPRGVSGGVTLLGLGAALLGAVFIGLIFALENAREARGLGSFAVLLLITAGSGVLGSLFDSILGTTLQAQYTTVARGENGVRTEHRTTDGLRNTLVQGVAFVTNDVVNLLSTAFAAACGALLFVSLPIS